MVYTQLRSPDNIIQQQSTTSAGLHQQQPCCRIPATNSWIQNSTIRAHQGLSPEQVQIIVEKFQNYFTKTLYFCRNASSGFHSNSRGSQQQPQLRDQSLYFQHQRQFPGLAHHQPPALMLGRPGQLQYPPGGDYHNQFSGQYHGPPPYNPPPVAQWSAEEEEIKYGPFSDGEAETMRRGGSRSVKKSRSRAASGAPHYATMSRVHDFSCKQSSLESNEGSTIKYTSQPQLNGNMSDLVHTRQLGQYPGHPESLTPLSLKTSITVPRSQHNKIPADMRRERKPSCPSLTRQDNVRSYDSSSAAPYPDLARHPLSYSVAPPQPPPSNTVRQYHHHQTLHHPGHTPHVSFPAQMTRSYVNNHRQNSSDDGHFDYEHSRSSSLGDINWPGLGYGDRGQEARMATPDGFKSLPYDNNVKLAINGVRKRTPRSGAVKIDLTCADKTIRRPGSAPDLVGGEETGGVSCHNSPGANSLRHKNGSLKDARARSTSSESRTGECNKKISVGPSPSTRKVAFAGIEDEPDSESESEKQSRDSVTSVEEEVWVKQPPLQHKPNPAPPAAVIVTKPSPGPGPPAPPQRGGAPPQPPAPQQRGGPPPPPPQRAPPPPPPHRESFPSSKAQQQQQQPTTTNKCNGIR